MPTLDLLKRSELTRALTNNEIDGNWTQLETYINAILAGTAGYEAGNAAKLGGQTTAQIFALPGWTAPTLLNGWVNYGGGYDNAGYYKDAYGIVHLRGLIKSGTIPSEAFNLPAGFRPASTELHAVIANNDVGQVTLFADGRVAVDLGSNAYVSLDGITFRSAA